MTTRAVRRRRAKERRSEAAVDTAVSSPPPAASSYPGSMLLYFYGEHEGDEEVAVVADANTMPAARSTSGHPFRVSFHFRPPPELSLIIVGGGSPDDGTPVVLAAHDDSVLFQMCFKEVNGNYTVNQFIYNAGKEGGPSPRPPTVSLLPPRYLTRKELENYYDYEYRSGPVHRRLDHDGTGLLRCGEDGEEFVVAELKMVVVDYDAGEKVAELLILRSGEWSVHRPTVVIQGGGEEEVRGLVSSWKTRCVLPLRDGLLCWVDVSLGLLLCNAFDSTPDELRFVPLPVDSPYYSNVSVTAGGRALKLVDIFPRCCCGGKGETECETSLHAYTIHSWIMRIQEDMVWVMDGMVDSTEIWALEAYKGLPRVHPVQPYASLDDPDIVCFEVGHREREDDWFIMLDMRNKELLSCRRRDIARGCYGQGFGKNVFPSRISNYFNPHPSDSSSMTGNHHLEDNKIAAPPAEESSQVINGGGNKGDKKAPIDLAMQASGIMAVFQEVLSYGLAHEHVVKAIGILSRDDTGRRFKSLLELPVSMRKDWLLMEIKGVFG